MELESTYAIVLQVIDYNDAQVVVHAYTSEHGRLAFIASKRSKTHRSKVLLQPLFLVEIVFYRNPKSELHRVKSVNLWKPYVDVPFNHGKTFICLFIAELLTKTLREQVSNQMLFNFLVNSLEMFDNSTSSWNSFHLSFMVHLSKFLGFYPTFGFDLSDSHNFSGLGSLLEIIKETPITQFAGLKLSREQRQAILNQLLIYYQHHLPIGGLQSHYVLSQF